MREEQPCKVACRLKVEAESAKNFKEKIDDEYRVNMYAEKSAPSLFVNKDPFLSSFL